MKKKTSNVQPAFARLRRGRRRTPNIEFSTDGVRIRELRTGEYGDNKNPAKYDLEDRLLDFAVSVVELTESLPNTRSGNHIAAQLLRCGTSPLCNHGEVEAAESESEVSGQWSL
jgi:hypothetical protein